VAIGIGLAAAVLVIALVLWPRPSGISGTISASVCNPGSGTSGSCAPRPATARVRITDCYSGILTSKNPLDNATWETRSDVHGGYHIDLAPGTYCVFAVKESTDQFPPTASQMSVTVRAGAVTEVDLLLGVPMGIGICLAAQDTIATPSGQVVVSQLHEGMLVWTLDLAGHRVAAPIQLVTHTPAPAGHHVVRLMLADGRVVEASPAHPAADGRRVGGLNVGESLDGSVIVRVDQLPYLGDTWDLLPAGPTGVYWAGDIALKSTLL
jgi:hypothetical protein